MREKHLQDRVEEVTAATRKPDSPYYKINPSGRVPYLVCEDGVGLEGSQPVSYYLDHCTGKPGLHAQEGAQGLAHRRLEEYARSVVDCVSVTVRELARPQEDRSATILEHERQRLSRLTDFWEGELSQPLMQGNINMVQITLACGLLLDQYYPGLKWREGHLRLAAWTDGYSARSSFIETRAQGTFEP